MSNKDYANRWMEAEREYWRTGRTGPFEPLGAPEATVHMGGMTTTFHALVNEMLPMFRTAFPDLETTAEDLIEEGDKVVVRARWTGTHRGAFMGVPATGKRVTGTEIHICRIVDGRLVEQWSEMDMMGLMQQLGAIPAQPEA